MPAVARDATEPSEPGEGRRPNGGALTLRDAFARWTARRGATYAELAARLGIGAAQLERAAQAAWPVDNADLREASGTHGIDPEALASVLWESVSVSPADARRRARRRGFRLGAASVPGPPAHRP